MKHSFSLKTLLWMTALLLICMPLQAVSSEAISWHAVDEQIHPLNNTLAYRVDRIWREDGNGEASSLLAEITLMAPERNARVELNDFVIMTAQDDAFYAQEAASALRDEVLRKGSPLVIPTGMQITLKFSFMVTSTDTRFFLVYRNAAASNFYATEVVFAPQGAAGTPAPPEATPTPSPVPTPKVSTSPSMESQGFDIGISDILIIVPTIQPLQPNIVRTTCFACHGTGKCAQCKGSGVRPGMYGQPSSLCTSCAYTGICSICGGLGYYEQTY